MIIDLTEKTDIASLGLNEWIDRLTNCTMYTQTNNGWKECFTISVRSDGSYLMERQTTHYPDGDLVPDPKILRSVFDNSAQLVGHIFNPIFKEFKLVANDS